MSASVGVYPALESTTAFAADDFAGKAVSILILPGAFDGTFFSGPLGYQRSSGFKILSADNRLVVIGGQILFLLAYVEALVSGHPQQEAVIQLGDRVFSLSPFSGRMEYL